jgi:hypothetical protein
LRLELVMIVMIVMMMMMMISKQCSCNAMLCEVL